MSISDYSTQRSRRQRPRLTSTASSSRMAPHTNRQTTDSWISSSAGLPPNYDVGRYGDEDGEDRRTWAPTSTPLRSDFDAMTYVNDQETNSVVAVPTSGLSHAQGISRSECYYGLDVTAPATFTDRHLATDYPEYMQEMQELFGEHKDLNIADPQPQSHPSPVPSLLQRSHSKRSASNRDFEVVGNTVLEDGPEKTVTISTWRERVAKESKEKGQPKTELSVYYVNPDEYSLDEGKRQQEIREAGSQNVRELTPESWNGRNPTKLRDAPLSPTRQRLTSMTSYRSSSPSPSQARLAYPSPAAPPMSSYARSNRNVPSSPTTSSRFVPRYGQLPSPPSSRDQDSRGINDVLASCTPSLLHISSVLKSMGIHTKEHLKAVAALTPETRDREVRHVALQNGITLIEWAVLLDRIVVL